MAKAKSATKSATKSVKAVKKVVVEPKVNAGYRVYAVPESIREAIKVKRANLDVTNESVIEAAVTGELPRVVQGLAALGLTGHIEDAKRPARWKVSDTTLGALRVASAQCGIPANQLLMASLALLCVETPKPRKKSAK